MWKSSTDFVFFAAEQDFTDSGKVHELFSELDPNVCIMLHGWSDNDFTHVCFCLAAQWTDTYKNSQKVINGACLELINPKINSIQDGHHT